MKSRCRLNSSLSIRGERDPFLSEGWFVDFDSHMDLDEFIEWLQIVESVFEYKDIPPDRKVKSVVIKLRKSVFLWWENLKCLRQYEEK